MSAEEELVDLARTAGMSKAAAERFAGQVLDAHAHELAEQIRADIIPELDEHGTREQQAEIDGRRGAADLIDPQKSAGLVRPGEEPTT
jgi:hypothetical protein